VAGPVGTIQDTKTNLLWLVVPGTADTTFTNLASAQALCVPNNMTLPSVGELQGILAEMPSNVFCSPGIDIDTTFQQMFGLHADWYLSNTQFDAGHITEVNLQTGKTAKWIGTPAYILCVSQ